MGTSMGMAGGHLLPDWLRIVWVVLYALILVLHLRHVIGMGGQDRAWHSGHVLMALGMVFMFLPGGIIALPITVGIVVFALAASAIAGWIIYTIASQRALDFLWIVQLVDMLGMTYMFVVQKTSVGALTYLFAIYFATEMGCWFLGAFHQQDPQQRVLPAVVGGGAVALKAEARPLAESSTLEARLTLGLMAAGMAYMFLAMLVGM
jgi:hypothetical protein